MYFLKTKTFSSMIIAQSPNEEFSTKCYSKDFIQNILLVSLITLVLFLVAVTKLKKKKQLKEEFILAHSSKVLSIMVSEN